jgi:8-oxo-dGTP pyrophosphatase MutT (NUDIX family)
MAREKSAGVVIYRDADDGPEYLVLHYDAGHWDFVKGKIENNETIRDTAIRETEEETGITGIEFNDEFEEKIDYFFRRNGTIVYKDVIYLLAKTDRKEITLSYEHQGYDWLSFDDAFERLTYDNAEEVLKKAHELVSG